MWTEELRQKSIRAQLTLELLQDECCKEIMSLCDGCLSDQDIIECLRDSYGEAMLRINLDLLQDTELVSQTMRVNQAKIEKIDRVITEFGKKEKDE